MILNRCDLVTVSTFQKLSGVQYNEPLVHQVLVSEMSNIRQASKSHKSRSQVAGGGKKPWKQKGSGRARAGSIRSPIWRGGGKTFASDNHNFKKKINKKMLRGALLSVLSELVNQDRLFIVESFLVDRISTKDANLSIKSLIGDVSSTLVFTDPTEEASKSFRNLQRLDCTVQENLTLYSLLKNDVVVFDRIAIETFMGRL